MCTYVRTYLPFSQSALTLGNYMDKSLLLSRQHFDKWLAIIGRVKSLMTGPTSLPKAGPYKYIKKEKQGEELVFCLK